MTKQQLGKIGEKIARRYVIEKLGHKVVEQNFRTKFGEIDLLCFDKVEDCYVIVEVRTRSFPWLDFTKVFPRRKVNKLKGLCRYVEIRFSYDCRLDFIFVSTSGNKYHLKYFQDFLALL